MPLTIVERPEPPETYEQRIARTTRTALEAGEEVRLPAPDAPTFASRIAGVLQAVTPDHAIVLERDERGAVVASREG